MWYQLAACCWTVTSCCHGDDVVSDRTQQPLSRTSLTPDKLHPKVNSLVIQAYNVDKQSVDFGMMTSETVFKCWDASKSSWSTGSCKVLPRLILNTSSNIRPSFTLDHTSTPTQHYTVAYSTSYG